MKTSFFKRSGVVALGAAFVFSLPTARAKSAATHNSQRIRFARGAESCVKTVTLSRRTPRISYMVRTRAGQRMSVAVTSLTTRDENVANDIVPVLNVISPAGEQSQAQNPKARRFDTMKTVAGDYRVEVGTNLMASNGTRGKCLLKIWIR